jgi:hypothetical protein
VKFILNHFSILNWNKSGNIFLLWHEEEQLFYLDLELRAEQSRCLFGNWKCGCGCCGWLIVVDGDGDG